MGENNIINIYQEISRNLPDITFVHTLTATFHHRLSIGVENYFRAIPKKAQFIDFE